MCSSARTGTSVPKLGLILQCARLATSLPGLGLPAQVGTSLPKLGLRYSAPGRRLPCPDGDFLAQAGTSLQCAWLATSVSRTCAVLTSRDFHASPGSPRLSQPYPIYPTRATAQHAFPLPEVPPLQLTASPNSQLRPTWHSEAIQGRQPQGRCWRAPLGFHRWDDVPRWRGLLAVLPGATWDVFVLKFPLGC